MMEGELERADQEIRELLFLFDEKEMEYHNPLLAFWRKDEVKKELQALTEQIDAWQCYRYEVQERLEILEKLQALMQKPLAQQQATKVRKCQSKLTAETKQSKIHNILEKQTTELARMVIQQKTYMNSIVHKNVEMEPLKLEVDGLFLQNNILVVPKCGLLNLVATKVFEEMPERVHFTNWKLVPAGPNNGYEGFLQDIQFLFEEVVRSEAYLETKSSEDLTQVCNSGYMMLTPDAESYSAHKVFTEMLKQK